MKLFVKLDDWKELGGFRVSRRCKKILGSANNRMQRLAVRSCCKMTTKTQQCLCLAVVGARWENSIGVQLELCM